MAQQVVNVGTQANDATGDLLRDAFTKINNNFAVFFTGNFPTAQMTVGPPPAGTTALTVVGLSGQSSIATSVGNVVIGGATGNVTSLQVNATTGNFPAATFDQSNSNGSYVKFTNNGTLLGYLGSAAGIQSGTLGTLVVESNGALNLAVGGGTNEVIIGTSGGTTFGTPTGGNKGAGSFNAVSGFINNVAIFAGTPVTTFTSNTGLSTNVAATGAVTVTNTGVLSITGTASQIAASASTGAVTLSLPQNVIIPTPASGTAFTVTAVSGALGASVSAGAIFVSNPSLPLIVLNSTGSNFGLISNNGSNAWSLGTGTSSTTSGTQVLGWNATGNLTSPAPVSGDNLTLTNVAGANAITINGNSAGTAVLKLNTQATTGAQTATFAASNKPGSGTTGPDKWIPINLDGTTHYVPAFL